MFLNAKDDDNVSYQRLKGLSWAHCPWKQYDRDRIVTV